MSNLLKLTTLTVLGLASLDQTLAAEASVETGVGECLLRTGRGMTTPYLGNIQSDDKVPYSSRKVSCPQITPGMKHLKVTPKQHKERALLQTCFNRWSNEQLFLFRGMDQFRFYFFNRISIPTDI